MKHTDAQRRRIFGMARNLGMDDELLHDAVFSVTGEAHISKLTVDQAAKVIQSLVGMSEKPRPGRLSPEARRKILALGYALGWQPKQVNGMCRRVTNVASIEWLTPRDAWKVTEAMKAMVERQKSEIGQKLKMEDGDENRRYHFTGGSGNIKDNGDRG